VQKIVSVSKAMISVWLQTASLTRRFRRSVEQAAVKALKLVIAGGSSFLCRGGDAMEIVYNAERSKFVYMTNRC